jgi:Helix-turn-helix.
MPEVSREAVMRGFGDAVRDLRSGHGLSQEKLAERAGLHRTYIGDVERGERNLSLVNLVRLAHALEVTFGELATAAESEWANRDQARTSD